MANASAARHGRGVITIVPVTSNVTRIMPFQTLLPADETGLRVESKAQLAEADNREAGSAKQSAR